MNLIFLLIWLFGGAPFFQVGSGLHYYFSVSRNSQEM